MISKHGGRNPFLYQTSGSRGQSSLCTRPCSREGQWAWPHMVPGHRISRLPGDERHILASGMTYAGAMPAGAGLAGPPGGWHPSTCRAGCQRRAAGMTAPERALRGSRSLLGSPHALIGASELCFRHGRDRPTGTAAAWRLRERGDVLACSAQTEDTSVSFQGETLVTIPIAILKHLLQLPRSAGRLRSLG